MNNYQEFSNPSLLVLSFEQQHHQTQLLDHSGQYRDYQQHHSSSNKKHHPHLKQSLASLETRYQSTTDQVYFHNNNNNDTRPKTTNTINPRKKAQQQLLGNNHNYNSVTLRSPSNNEFSHGSTLTLTQEFSLKKRQEKSEHRFKKVHTKISEASVVVKDLYFKCVILKNIGLIVKLQSWFRMKLIREKYKKMIFYNKRVRLLMRILDPLCTLIPKRIAFQNLKELHMHLSIHHQRKRLSRYLDYQQKSTENSPSIKNFLRKNTGGSWRGSARKLIEKKVSSTIDVFDNTEATLQIQNRPTIDIQNFDEPLLIHNNLRLRHNSTIPQKKIPNPEIRRKIKQQLEQHKINYKYIQQQRQLQIQQKLFENKIQNQQLQKQIKTITQRPASESTVKRPTTAFIQYVSKDTSLLDFNYGVKKHIKKLHNKKLSKHRSLLKEDLRKKGQTIDVDRQRYLYNKFFTDFQDTHYQSKCPDFKPVMVNQIIQKYQSKFEQVKSEERVPITISHERKRPFLGISEGINNQFQKQQCMDEWNEILNDRIRSMPPSPTSNVQIKYNRFKEIKREIQSQPISPNSNRKDNQTSFKSIAFEEILPEYSELLNKFMSQKSKMKTKQKDSQNVIVKNDKNSCKFSDIHIKGRKQALVPKLNLSSKNAIFPL